ncbi:MAG: hemerythrin domain-containing protein [Kofleriaceae bacterium]
MDTSHVLASLAQLERCHRRHDDVMEGLLAAARRLAAGRPDTGDVDTVHDAVAYFKRSITRHFLDEEGSLFPRLSTRRPELAEQLASLSAEHPSQVALQNQIGELAAKLDGDSRQGAGKSLLEVAERLEVAHRTHVAREDHLFSLAAEALTADDDAGIIAEMETRRDRRNEDGHHGQPAPRRPRADTLAGTPKAIRAPDPKAKPKKQAKPAAKKPAAVKKPAAKAASKRSAAKKSSSKKKPASKKRR